MNLKLSDKEKKLLLDIARKNIESKLIDVPEYTVNIKDLPKSLKVPRGAFVSVYKNSELNGCIGHIGEDDPLWLVVKRCAISAAFNDDRFPSIKKNDLNDLSIEISILTPAKKITSIEEIEPGKHGIIIQKGNSKGTYLPHVAKRMNWNRIELLQHCSKDKAGMDIDGWKDAEIFIYESETIK